MLVKLLEVLEKLRGFAGRYERYLTAAGKAVLMAAGLAVLARFGRLWDQQFLTGTVIAVFAAAAAFMPPGFFTFGMFAAALGMLFKLSLEAFLLFALAVLLMLVLYYSFHPRHGIIAGVFLCFVLAGWPEAALLILPLFLTPFALIPMAFGWLGAEYLMAVGRNLSAITSAEASAETLSVDLIMQLAGGFISRPMLVWFGAAAAVFFVIWLIHRYPFPYAWPVSALTGAVLWILAGALTGTQPVSSLIWRTLGALLLSLAVILLRVPGDFAQTEYVEFEDDDYYYYVKAVPKLKVPLGKAVVKTFSRKDTPAAGNISDNPAGKPEGQTESRTAGGASGN